MKHCKSCDTTKELEAFSLNKMGRQGRKSICKDCTNKRQRGKWQSVTEDTRVKKRASAKKSRKNNLAMDAMKSARRRARTKQREPSWNDQLVMRMIYEDCPEGCEVDHIVPMYGENVSGLHVHYNLQYLTKEENCRKGNTYVT